MRDFLAGHRPHVYALAVFLVCLAAAVVAPTPRPVYAMDGSLTFTPFNSSGNGNAFRADSSNMVYFAAVVERIYNQEPTTARVASSEATLYGMGVRDGSEVTLPNSGGQWGTSFDQPYLRIQVVSGDEATTRARFAAIVSELRGIASARQASVGVAPSAQVNLDLIPTEPPVQYVNGSASREKVAGVLLGGLAAAGVYVVTTRRTRRRSPLTRLTPAVLVP